MNANAFVGALAALGLTQAALARILDLDKNTPNRWATGERPVPNAVALLLEAWVAYPELIPED